MLRKRKHFDAVRVINIKCLVIWFSYRFDKIAKWLNAIDLWIMAGGPKVLINMTLDLLFSMNLFVCTCGRLDLGNVDSWTCWLVGSWTCWLVGLWTRGLVDFWASGLEGL